MDTLRPLLRLIAHHRRLLPIVCGIITFVSALTIVVPLYTKFLLQHVIPEQASRLLNLSFLFFLAFLVIRFVFTALQDLAVVVLRQKLERSHNERYLEAVFRLKLSELQKHTAGELLNRFTVFINEIEWFLCDFIFFVFYALFIFVFLSAVMVVVNPALYLLVIAFIPLHVLNFRRFAGRMRSAAEEDQGHRDRLSSFLLQSLDGWSDVRNYLLQKLFMQRNAELARRVNGAHFGRKGLSLQEQHVQTALILTNHVAVVALSCYQIIHGYTHVGTVFFFLLLLDFFYSPIYRFSAVNESLQAAGVKIRRMAELIDNAAMEARTTPEDVRRAPAVGTLEVRGLSVGGLFQGLDYTFERGRVYFITGPSGCGKSTFFHLLSRLHTPSAGTVRIDGEDTSGWSEPRVRRFIQGASQESQLFKRSVALNISMGEPETLDTNRLRRAAWQSTAEAFIQRLPNQYHHEVQEGGANFSGGEQQRLNLARLFYHDAPILLLDEPTSALDVATEKLFFERLEELKREKIILVINHREQTLRYADVLLRLTPGGLVEEQPRASVA
jgi:ABC-type bacteriocin/lantibiotic exporter with double-glycine peptidase domain